MDKTKLAPSSSSSLDVPDVPNVISHPIQRTLTAPFIVGPDPPPEEVSISNHYVNPLDGKPRWNLSARAYALRQGAKIGFGMQDRFQTPPDPHKTLYLDSTLASSKGKGVIKVDVWVPPCCELKKKKRRKHHKKHHKGHAKPLRPALINFHGGGFVLGQGTDDARWALAAMSEIDAIVFAVNYRLAPSHPFPIPTEDCVDAICQIAKLATTSPEFNVDPDRIFLSGFSAGGNLALSSWLVLADPKRWDYDLPAPIPKIAGISLFYPLLDWTMSRPRKRATCVRPDLTLPSGMTDLFDASYIYPPLPVDQRTDWRLSPGLMSAEMLDRMPPLHLCLCEYDMLLTEGLTFAQRLRERGKFVEVRVVLGAKHAWDKPPPFVPKESAGIEYAAALRTIKGWIRDMDVWDGGGGSSLSAATSASVSSVDVSRQASNVEGVAELKPVFKSWDGGLDQMNSAESLESRHGVVGVEVPAIKVQDYEGMPVAPRITLVEQKKKGRRPTPQEYFHRSISAFR
ncbi:Alpha/beta-hydrolase [Coniochaeta hoffmannii]|uniref:Alpha/beta-hydrolase n=1 Tax=Coniochaeta hoffmannii TaxID=91930 RepID=A0AA38R3H3_9PEZI|nr:Alpha/beta-hydrolase [Coniochaeta hoffmannii]